MNVESPVQVTIKANSNHETNISKLVKTCAAGCQSNKDYRELRMFFKEELKEHGLVYLVDADKVRDTYSLFETVFMDEHDLPTRHKLEMLKNAMDFVGKTSLANRVMHCSNQTHIRNDASSLCLSSPPSRVLSAGSSLESAFEVIAMRLGKDWKRLAKRLQFTGREIHKIKCDRDSLQQCIQYMLNRWHRKHGQQASKVKLIEALHQIKRQDIVDLLEEWNCRLPTLQRSYLSNAIQAVPTIQDKEQSTQINHIVQQHNITQSFGRMCISCSSASVGHDNVSTHVSSTPTNKLQTTSQPQPCPDVFSQQKQLPQHLLSKDGSGGNSGCGLQDGIVQMAKSSSLPQGAASSSSANSCLPKAKQQIPSRQDAIGRFTHVVIVAVGRTRVGKTSSINNIMGTMVPPVDSDMPDDVDQFKSGKPYAHSYTRRYVCNSVTYKLTFVDTPGLGDNSTNGEALTDRVVCERIKWATEPLKRDENTHIMIVYFSKATTNLDASEVQSIKMLEETIGVNVSCVLLTHAKSVVESASLNNWDKKKKQVQEQLPYIEKEFAEDFKMKNDDDDELINLSKQEQEVKLEMKLQKEIKADSEGLPTRRKTQSEFLKILGRKQLIDEKKNWFPQKLCRELPVMLIENDESLRTVSGVKEIYEKWVELLDEASGLFCFLTGNLNKENVECYDEEHRTPPVTLTYHSTEANNSGRAETEPEQRANLTRPTRPPTDCSSPRVQQERNGARQSIRSRAVARVFAMMKCCGCFAWLAKPNQQQPY